MLVVTIHQHTTEAGSAGPCLQEGPAPASRRPRPSFQEASPAGNGSDPRPMGVAEGLTVKGLDKDSS